MNDKELSGIFDQGPNMPVRMKELLAAYNPEWMGFNGWLLNVPRLEVLEQVMQDPQHAEAVKWLRSPKANMVANIYDKSKPHPKVGLPVASAVGLYPVKNTNPQSYGYPQSMSHRRFEIYKDFTKQMTSDKGYVVITDDEAMLCESISGGARPLVRKVRRFNKFVDQSGTARWEITGELAWNNHPQAGRDSSGQACLPATYRLLFATIEQAAYKAIRAIGAVDSIVSETFRFQEEQLPAADWMIQPNWSDAHFVEAYQDRMRELQGVGGRNTDHVAVIMILKWAMALQRMWVESRGGPVKLHFS